MDQTHSILVVFSAGAVNMGTERLAGKVKFNFKHMMPSDALGPFRMSID